MYEYAYPNQIRDQIRCKYIKYAPYFIESLLFAFSFLETPQMTLFHPYIWVLIHANIVLICRIQVHVKYASNTHQIRNQIQANMGVFGARPRWAEYMSNTHQIRNQIHANMGVLAVGWVHVKYASNTQANTIKYGCTWRWVEYTSNVHQIRKQIQANMGVIGVRPWWPEYTSNIHQILK